MLRGKSRSEFVVGWMRGDHQSRQYYCPPHVPKSQRTLGERFTPVDVERALRCEARCATCDRRLARFPLVSCPEDIA